MSVCPVWSHAYVSYDAPNRWRILGPLNRLTKPKQDTINTFQDRLHARL
jgi:hypothetical protein